MKTLEPDKYWHSEHTSHNPQWKQFDPLALSTHVLDSIEHSPYNSYILVKSETALSIDAESPQSDWSHVLLLMPFGGLPPPNK